MLSSAVYGTVVSSSLYDTQMRVCAQRLEQPLCTVTHPHLKAPPLAVHTPRLLQLLCTHRGCANYCAHTQRLLQLLYTHRGCSNYCAHTEVAPVTVHTEAVPITVHTHTGCFNYCAHTETAPVTGRTQRLLQSLCTAPMTVHILASVYHSIMLSPQCRILQMIACLSDCFVKLTLPGDWPVKSESCSSVK